MLGNSAPRGLNLAEGWEKEGAVNLCGTPNVTGGSDCLGAMGQMKASRSKDVPCIGATSVSLPQAIASAGNVQSRGLEGQGNLFHAKEIDGAEKLAVLSRLAEQRWQAHPQALFQLWLPLSQLTQLINSI